MLKSIGDTSTNTGLAFSKLTIDAEAKKLKAGQITSSPGCSSSAISANSNASVPELQAKACFAPEKNASSFSSCSISVPFINDAELITF